jgi:tripartite-type tricarboxylate transporter receptor subunit TctC
MMYKPGGSANNAVQYVGKKPAYGNQILFIGGSFAGLFKLPYFEFKYDHFDIIVQFVTNVYALAVPTSSPFKKFQDLVNYAKIHPNRLAMGSNKIGSLHHRVQTALFATAKVKVRFVPYKGTGAVVKDVISNHLPIGLAQPGKWLPQMKVGLARVLLMLDNERLDHPAFKDIPTPGELGCKFKIPVQFHGFMARKGTPPDLIKKIQKAFKKVLSTKPYKAFLKRQPHVRTAYRDDIKGMNADFAQSVVEARAFMVRHKILKK